MKILRSVNRRGFSVGSAGWFTILRPNAWFPASRLPSTHQGFGIQTKGTTDLVTRYSASNIANGQVSAVPWQLIERSGQYHHLMRSASIILGALAITSAMLWWIMHP
jgi:hypothetical protein